MSSASRQAETACYFRDVYEDCARLHVLCLPLMSSGGRELLAGGFLNLINHTPVYSTPDVATQRFTNPMQTICCLKQCCSPTPCFSGSLSNSSIRIVPIKEKR